MNQREAQGRYTLGMRIVLLIIKVPKRTNSMSKGRETGKANRNT